MSNIDASSKAHGLKQALAATQLFYGSKANEGKRMDRQEFIEALDGVPDLSSPVFVDDRGLPSVLVRLPRSEYMSQLLEKLIVASGLLSSKSNKPLPWCLLTLETDTRYSASEKGARRRPALDQRRQAV